MYKPGEKPYNCEICLNSLTRRDYLCVCKRAKSRTDVKFVSVRVLLVASVFAIAALLLLCCIVRFYCAAVIFGFEN